MGKRQKASWSQQAISDLADLHDQIAVHDGVAADKYLAQVIEAVEVIERHPESGMKLPGVLLTGEFRSAVIRNHRVVYRLLKGAPRIYRVWDCRQDPDGLWPSLMDTE